MLSEAADHSVVISAIGFATNLAALLQTGADQYSELSGWDLVALKVRTVVWQGGWYPPLHGFGHHTYNWDCGAGNDLTIGWQNLNLLSHPNATQAPQARASGKILNYSLSH